MRRGKTRTLEIAVAKCPNCESALAWDEMNCKVCAASFDGASAWRPIPDTAEEKQLLINKHRHSTESASPASFGMSHAVRLAVATSLVAVGCAFAVWIGDKLDPDQVRLLRIATGYQFFVLGAAAILRHYSPTSGCAAVLKPSLFTLVMCLSIVVVAPKGHANEWATIGYIIWAVLFFIFFVCTLIVAVSGSWIGSPTKDLW
jgi:hypothetical protein